MLMDLKVLENRGFRGYALIERTRYTHYTHYAHATHTTRTNTLHALPTRYAQSLGRFWFCDFKRRFALSIIFF